MSPTLAAFICACGIAGLFYLDRDRTDQTSAALWLPVMYFWILGSRAVSAWLNLSPPSDTNVQLEGSPLDAAFYGVLLVAAIGVLIRRRRKSGVLLVTNWPILIYFLYCLISVIWSYHPDVASKRWIKSILDPAMMMVVVTDRQPVVALRRFISRVGFILLPLSLLLIKYFPDLGRSFTPSGEPMNTGVTTNKNTLGLVILVISLGTLWHIISLVRAKGTPDRRRHLIAHGVLLAFGVDLFSLANSATSIACFGLGASLIIATNLRSFTGRPARVRALCLAILLAGGLTFFFTGTQDVASTLGRQSNLSGRTDIWAALLHSVPSPIIGAGFESYWISPSVDQAWRTLSRAGWWHPEVLVTEAHNGYIEIYLNLGWVGIGLLVLVLVSGYWRAVAALGRNPSVGGLALAYLMTSVYYSITEAGFRSLNPMWMFLLLAIIASTGVIQGLFKAPAARKRSEVSSEPSGAYRSGLVSLPRPAYRPSRLPAR